MRRTHHPHFSNLTNQTSLLRFFIVICLHVNLIIQLSQGQLEAPLPCLTPPVHTPAGRQRLLYQLAGVVPSPLLLELLSCPLCARSLETLELELGDLEGGRGDADGLHDFPQVRGRRMW